MRLSTILWLIGFLLLAGAAAPSLALAAAPPAPQVTSAVPWWVWPLALFLVTFLLGIAAVLAGVGGGVLFVPIVSGLFPFHLDFVRSAGLLIALAGALAAGPSLLMSGMASLRLALPFALIGSVFSMIGALVSFQVPADVMQAMLGITIALIVLLMLRTGSNESSAGRGGDRIAAALGLAGVYFDSVSGRHVDWRVQHTVAGFAAFAIIGLVGGMFGLGAGWANVPALNLLLGVPLRGAVATSSIVMSIVNTSAAWIYIERGAVLPMIVTPSVVGVMLGARIGARLLHRLPAEVLRRIVIAILLLAGSRALLAGFGLWN